MNSKSFFVFVVGVFAISHIFAQSPVLLAVNDFEKKIEATKEKIILDVRTKDEFSKGHVANATMIDFYKDDFKQQIGKLDKSKPIFVYCASGGRSGSASKMLSEMGFKSVFDLKGGMRAWAGAQKPVVK